MKELKINQQIGQAYDLVVEDLFSRLKKMKDGDKLRFGNLGTLVKTQQKLRSSLNGRTYLFYRIGFRASALLKKELDK